MNDPNRFASHVDTKAKRPPPPSHLTLTPKTAPAFFAKAFPGAPMTTWHNRRCREQRIDSLTLPPWANAPEATTGRIVVSIPPNSSCPLPSMYDRSVLVVRDGVIVGGMAPGLTPEGVSLTVHEAILEGNDLFEPGPEAA